LTVYLAAPRRFANPDATFLMHDFYFPQPVPVTNRHQSDDISVGLTGARKRFMEVLKATRTMTDEQSQSVKFLDDASIKTAVTAKKVGSHTRFSRQSRPPEHNFSMSSIDHQSSALGQYPPTRTILLIGFRY